MTCLPCGRALYHNERDGLVDNITTGGEMGEYDKDGGRVRILFEPSDDFSAILTYEYHESTLEGSDSITQEYGNV